MATYLYQCAECEVAVRVTRMIADRDNPPTEEEGTCVCGGSEGPQWRRVFEAAGTMTHSYLDGRKRGGAYEKLREATKLEREAFATPPEKRGDLIREVKKLRSTD